MLIDRLRAAQQESKDVSQEDQQVPKKPAKFLQQGGPRFKRRTLLLLGRNPVAQSDDASGSKSHRRLHQIDETVRPGLAKFAADQKGIGSPSIIEILLTEVPRI